MRRDDSRAKQRPERIPLAKQRIIGFDQRDGYVRRFVNDVPGRIASFIRAGWTIVSENGDKSHDGLAHVETQLGSAVQRVVNKGINAEARVAILMEIPKDLFDEDQAAKQDAIDKKEASFDHEGLLKAAQMYGRVNIRK